MQKYYLLRDAKVPNANGFASQWKIGFKFYLYVLESFYQPLDAMGGAHFLNILSQCFKLTFQVEGHGDYI